MGLHRRSFIRAAAAMGAWPLLAGGEAIGARPWQERRDLFPEGVASGDPAHDSIVLWTRYPREASARDARLTVEVAEDDQFDHVIARRRVRVSERDDWTCRVLVQGLRPATIYHYRFTDADGQGSRIGRTITAPAANDPRTVQFAFVSCQDINQSALNAYRRMLFEDRRAAAENQLGFVLHLGDFIYEILWYPEERATNYGRTIREVTRFASHEVYREFHIPVTLEDYRSIYRAYLHDPDLQDARAWLPFVCIWDNHEFSWRGWQSQQIFGSQIQPAQTRKVAANRAWFEFQPARVRDAAGHPLTAFASPNVQNTALTTFDRDGLGTEPGNLAAINSLIAYRQLRYGAHVDLIITDLFSFRTQERTTQSEGSVFSLDAFADFYPQDVMEILDAGRDFNQGAPPASIDFGSVHVDNFARELPPQTMLGIEQKRWFLRQLEQASATWKIWGCSNGILDWRADPQNLPSSAPAWPSAGYACFGGGDFSTAYAERGEIFDFVRNHGITGFAIVSGDRHSFWAGLAAKQLPPHDFDPVGVAFVTGSISAPGLLEAVEHVFPHDHPLRALYLFDRADGGAPEPAVNLLLRHGVRACLDYAQHHDIERARALSNPNLSPHLSFVDMGGHGYSVVRASESSLETEFVCTPRPNERSATDDGGPILYRVRHRAEKWDAGEHPHLQQQIVEGDPKFSI